MPEVTTSAAHAGRMVGSEIVDVVVDYLLPVAGFVAGAMVGDGLLGGPYVIAHAFDNAQNYNSNILGTSSLNRLGGIVFGLIWAAVGYAFWRLGKRDGWIAKVIGKTTGAFFFGTALLQILRYGVLGQTAPSTGIVTQMAGFVQEVAQGG